MHGKVVLNVALALLFTERVSGSLPVTGHSEGTCITYPTDGYCSEFLGQQSVWVPGSSFDASDLQNREGELNSLKTQLIISTTAG